jgi:hypothetical protein
VLKTASPTVSRLAAFTARGKCGVAEFALAHNVELDSILTGTEKEPAFGQSPYAFARGEIFENLVKDVKGNKPYAPLLELLAEEFPVPDDVETVDLRRRYSARAKGVMQKRADDTRDLLVANASGKGVPTLIDGGVLQALVAGRTANYEADGLALRIDGQLMVIEMKSFPIIDAQAMDAGALAAALDQGALYILLCRRILESVGLDPFLVSPTLLLVCPRNTGLKPCLKRQDVSPRITRMTRALATVEADWGDRNGHDPSELLAMFAEAADLDRVVAARFEVLEEACQTLGTEFGINCLGCGMYRFCRDRAHEGHSPALLDTFLTRELVGIDSLARAAELSAGARPGAGEEQAAQALVEVARMTDAARRRAPHTAGRIHG